MASLKELRGLFSEDELRQRVYSATLKAGFKAATDPENFPSVTADTGLQDARKAWGARVVNQIESVGSRVFLAVLADNSDATVANIIAATDSQIETSVAKVIDVLAQFG